MNNSITEYIKNNRIKHPDNGLYFANDVDDKRFISYYDLFETSCRVFSFLKKNNLKKGSTLIFQITDDYDFVITFWACLFGGIIPVPLSAQNSDQVNNKVINVCRQIEEPVIITDQDRYSEIKDFINTNKVAGIDFKACFAEDYKKELCTLPLSDPIPLDSTDVALIQYSSGSTGSPKGVVLTHGNIISNAEAMYVRLEVNDEDVMVSWLPYTHDMGIVGLHILPVSAGINIYKIPTEVFIRKPGLWLDIATKVGCTAFCSPDFGYKYIMKFFSKKKAQNWDLTKIRLLLNGAEPVSAQICNNFMNAMHEYGLRKDIMLPVYGMAEACLGVTFPKIGEPLKEVFFDRSSLKISEKAIISSKEDHNAVSFVEVGYPLECNELMICDDDGEELAELYTGNICIRGSNITSGYYNNAEKNNELFLENGWLQTGDLGLIKDGRLIVTGRKKDILFVNGQNFYPNDLEDVIKSSYEDKVFEAVVCGHYSHEMERDHIIAFLLYRRDLNKFLLLSASIRRYLFRRTGVRLDDIIPVKKIPRTTSGKVQRYLLLQNYLDGEYNEVIEKLEKLYKKNREDNLLIAGANITDTEKKLLKLFGGISGIGDLSIYDSFFDYGSNSLTLIKAAKELDELYPGKITAADLFTYHNIHMLADYIDNMDSGCKQGENSGKAAHDKDSSLYKKGTAAQEAIGGDSVAIIGMSCKMPMADNAEQFWSNIINGINCIRAFPYQRVKDIEEYLSGYKNYNKNKLCFRNGAYLDRIDEFDSQFFKISPKEASLINPVQRLLLEEAFHAAEEAGYGGSCLEGSDTGVFIGAISEMDLYNYKDMIAFSSPDLLPVSAVGNLSSIMANRISYAMDLKGPSLVIDTACSSSLTSIHAACNSLRNKECSMALVGSARINFVPLNDENHKIGIESSDDMTRAFDVNSDGSGIGEGIVTMLLKPLKTAVRDNDNIHAVIRGSAVNQDGGSMGITSPNAASQSCVIQAAWKDAGINPESISYIEAHGTGTKLGDSIELKGLKDAYGRHISTNQKCAVGSLKSNIGHLYDCAGIAGVLKSVMALKNKMIPPSIDMNTPNAECSFHRSPFYINTKARKWKESGAFRRCAVSSFGIGGTNCHIILEEYPENAMEKKEKRESTGGDYYLLPISAKDPSALKELICRYKLFLDSNTEYSPADICYTASVGRGHYKYRIAVLFNNFNELKRAINYTLRQNTVESHEEIGVFCSNMEQEKEVHYRVEKDLISVDDCYSVRDGNKKDILGMIGGIYADGGDIQWEKLYKHNPRRISIPLYPFNRNRCWCIADDTGNAAVTEIKENTFYTNLWVESAGIPGNVSSYEDQQATIILDNSIGEDGKLCDIFKNHSCDARVFEYKKISGEYNGTLIAGILSKIEEYNAGRIVFITGSMDIRLLDGAEQLEQYLGNSLYMVFFLIKALVDNISNRRLEFDLITECAEKVSGRERTICPQNAAAIGLIKVLRKECKRISFKCIDKDEATPVEMIYCEVLGKNGEYYTAYREGIRYVQQIDYADMNNFHRNEDILSEKGTVVITGGLGAVGIEAAKTVAPKGKGANLILINRSAMPRECEWDRILAEGIDAGLIKKIKALTDLKQIYKNVDYYNADISNECEVRSIFDTTREKYGRIHGIIHGAGIPGKGFFINKDFKEFKNVIKAKIHGTFIIDKITQNEGLDFFIMFSSALTIDGEIGQSDYVAANMFLDSYSAYRNMLGENTKTINWVAFSGEGMAAKMGYQKDNIFLELNMEFAMDAFKHACKSTYEKLVIGQMNIEGLETFRNINGSIGISDRLLQKQGHYINPGEGNKIKKSAPVFKEVILSGRDNGRYSNFEKNIAGIMGNLLEIYRININDAFFELGADSILLKRFYQEVDKRYPGMLNVSDLFAYPTISGLSAYMEKLDDKVDKLVECREEDSVSKLFKDIDSGRISLDEAVVSLTNMDENELE